MVAFRELLESSEFQGVRAALPIALGKDQGGNALQRCIRRRDAVCREPVEQCTETKQQPLEPRRCRYLLYHFLVRATHVGDAPA